MYLYITANYLHCILRALFTIYVSCIILFAAASWSEALKMHLWSVLILAMQTGLGSSVGRVSAPRSGGTGFDPGPRHIKVVNNGTSCSPLGIRIFGVGLGLVVSVSV